MKWIRRVHSWLGVLFAPSILLFVVSGLLQMFGCHEGEGADQPSGFVVRLSQIHMKQTLELPRRRSASPAAMRPAQAATPTAEPSAPRAEPPAAEAASRARPTTLPLKLFFLMMGIGLITSTLLGLYMAFTPKRDRKLLATLLAVGTVLPIVLMVL